MRVRFVSLSEWWEEEVTETQRSPQKSTEVHFWLTFSLSRFQSEISRLFSFRTATFRCWSLATCNSFCLFFLRFPIHMMQLINTLISWVTSSWKSPWSSARAFWDRLSLECTRILTGMRVQLDQAVLMLLQMLVLSMAHDSCACVHTHTHTHTHEKEKVQLIDSSSFTVILQSPGSSSWVPSRWLPRRWLDSLVRQALHPK